MPGTDMMYVAVPASRHREEDLQHVGEPGSCLRVRYDMSVTDLWYANTLRVCCEMFGIGHGGSMRLLRDVGY